MKCDSVSPSNMSVKSYVRVGCRYMPILPIIKHKNVYFHNIRPTFYVMYQKPQHTRSMCVYVHVYVNVFMYARMHAYMGGLQGMLVGGGCV